MRESALTKPWNGGPWRPAGASLPLLLAGGAAFTVFFLVAVVIGDPLAGLLLLAAGILVSLVLLGALSLKRAVIFFLVTKPLVDLTWRWSVYEVFEQRLNLQSFIAVFVILLAGAAVLVARREITTDPKLTAFLICAGISVVLSPGSSALNEYVRLAAGVAQFYLAGLVLADEGRFQRFTHPLLLAMAVPVLLGVLQLTGHLPYSYWDYRFGQPIGRVSGTYLHPLAFVFNLIFLLPLSLYCLTRTAAKKATVILLVTVVATALLLLVFTYHRAGYLAIAMEILIWLWLTNRRKIFAGVMLAFLGFVFLRWGWIQETYIALVVDQGGRLTFSPDMLRGRGMQWYVFLSSFFEQHPIFWLFGNGASLADGYVPGFGFWSSNEPHNDFIRTLFAYGLVGLTLYLSFLVAIFRRSLSLLRAPDPFSRDLGTIMLTVLAGFLLLSITTEPMRYPTGSWYFFATASAVTVRCRMLRARPGLPQ